MPGWVIALIVVAVLVLVFVTIYNGLVRGRNEVKSAWAQIDVQLKRRYDLIPNLIETVRGYMTHERETFEGITKARAAAMQAQGVASQAQAESQLGGFLGRLMAVAENYPELKANTNFLALQEELASTENKLSFARQYYNDAVLKYNTACETIPTNFVANMGGFQKSEFFELQSAEERAAPKVKF